MCIFYASNLSPPTREFSDEYYANLHILCMKVIRQALNKTKERKKCVESEGVLERERRSAGERALRAKECWRESEGVLEREH